MMVGVSKRMKRAAGIGFFAGIRLTRRNALFMIWVVFFLAIMWLMWKMLVYAAWGMCYMFYGIFLIYKYMFLGAKWVVLKVIDKIKGKPEELPGDVPPVEREQ